MPQLTNFTYDEITIGQTASYSKQVGEQDIQLFAAVSGDVNPVHLDEEFAAASEFGERIAHGMLTGALVSAALAMKLPGPGTVYLAQSLRFRRPVKIGETVTVNLEVIEKKGRAKFVTLDCKVSNQHGQLVASGTADVKAPTEKMQFEQPPLPRIEVQPQIRDPAEASPH